MTEKSAPSTQVDVESLKEKATNDPVQPQFLQHSRAWWQRVPFTTSKAPPPPKSSIDDSELIPEAKASLWAAVTFGWITPLMTLGYARPLEAPDLWKLQDHRSAAHIADLIDQSYTRRVKAASEYNERLRKGEVSPGLKGVWWSITGKRTEKEKEWREKSGLRKASLTFAINDSVKWWFWSAGILKVIGDTAQVTSPLVVKAIIEFGAHSYAAHRYGVGTVPPIGKGIGLAFALIIMQLISSITTNHFFYRSTSAGVLIRGGLINGIYKRSLRLTSRSRSTLTNGKLINHISTDVSRIDFCAGFFHMSWSSPIQLVICLVLLILQLGPSALAGFAIFFILTPIQTRVMKYLFAMRRKSMEWTDKRARLLQELLGGMKVVKFFAWEIPFLDRLSTYRREEMVGIRSLSLARSGMNAVAMSMPILASVIAFVIYAATGHDLEAGVIFTSLTLFNLLRMPLMFLPLSLSSIADAAQAISRLTVVYEAELLDDTIITDKDLDAAIEAKAASFSWDAPPPSDEKKGKKDKGGKHGSKKAPTPPPVTSEKPINEDEVFKVRDITMTIPRGQLVAIVGSVGSGKTSLLQGLVGEMRRTTGSVTFGGSVSYCPQTAWIQNATVRENIIFGQPWDEEKYWKAVRDSCLEPDLHMLPNGDLTEVGEKGISLSGGQKQRLSICRAIYSDTEIQIFDDPLSALDAHVGKAVFQNVLKECLAGKTRVLVTHALHFLPEVDYIYVVSDGRVVEQGTYSVLMTDGLEFFKFMKEFGTSKEQEEEEKEMTLTAEEEEALKKKTAKMRNATASASNMMQTEERNTGAVSWKVYKDYFKAGNGTVLVPLVIFSLILMQVGNVIGSYWLVWWQENQWHQPQGFYMGIYAGLGVAQAFIFFFMGASFSILAYFASRTLHRDAIKRVMHAPMSFFETTPLGRIMNRFSKDIDTIDNLLNDSLRMFLATFTGIIGAAVLISIVLPWFLIAIFVTGIAYAYSAAYYRASARELKRLDSILRSSLYAHFSESLSGLTTIRAYGESKRFLNDNERRIDVENRAYWLTVTNQRWLGVRLDFLGSLLTFIVAIMAVATRFTISPAQTGLVLSYILNVQQLFGWMVRQIAEVENNMNSVERIVYYANDIEKEAPYEIAEKKPAATWPDRGQIELKDVVLKYRPELPPVLKGVTVHVKGGEKIGIVGRTGAGKSSIMTALYRIVELASGSITIDGVDIATIGLSDLRQSLAIIPQDPLLFSGTLRSNLDPFNLQDDATLWDALKRSHLVESNKAHHARLSEDDAPSGTHTPVNRFTLDSVIEDEGGNLSVGQRSLVSLARALVKNSKVIILDEATASVDYETDRKIQDTIANEFNDRTILCIAHRLRTIISYDRICVLDAGQIAEFDTPENLYAQPGGIFRGMCERSSINLEDIQLARKRSEEY